ncbi:uncharacterized protein N7469_003980 [Penicillium citrinum]|uniref:DUF7702 domain-containing protein n=1 Tax=Penicillium citrinum TaxID=5077 RepID=A0A9W9P3T5_PENCI|nr:uncharacterized protein N7469_003980 [Penicillium citrinum]KAJ5234812.1 hypothetical protein N7469_003980 [Penicillium citrinum]
MPASYSLSRVGETPISTARQNIAMAEIVIFSAFHLVQFPVRFAQEWRYWHHRKDRHPARCFFYSWFSMVGLLSQLRIASAALIISTKNPNKSMLIAESSMQSVGLSPLLFEVSLILLRGQAGEYGRGKSKWSLSTRFALHGFRFPIFIAIVVAIVGGIVDIQPCGEAGSVVLVVTFVFVCGLVGWLSVKSQSILPIAGRRGILLIMLSLPFLLIRVAYFLLQEYGPSKFNTASGHVGALVGMGLLMEIISVAIFLTARAIVEPFSDSAQITRIARSDDVLEVATERHLG